MTISTQDAIKAGVVFHGQGRGAVRMIREQTATCKQSLQVQPKREKKPFATAGFAAWNEADGAVVLIVPIVTVSEANVRGREKWTTRHKRASGQRMVMAWMLRKVTLPPMPVHISLTRIAPRKLDGHDNLRASMKSVVDEICAAIGVDDKSDEYTFDFQQATSDGYGVAIRIQHKGEI